MARQDDQLVILYDGVCGLCHRLVRFVLRRDRRARFRFASLQSPLARDLLRRHGRNPDDLDTLYLVVGRGTAGEHLLARSTAALRILDELGGGWRLAAPLRLLPPAVRDLGYALLARTRYRIFGKYDACPLPEPAQRARFLDLPAEEEPPQ